MSKYTTLKYNPPKFEIKEGAREVIFNLISCMCDNKYTLKLKKDEGGEFKLNGMGFSLSNFQFKCQPYEIEWSADESEWNKVFKMINSGTSVIESVVSR